MYNHVYHPKFCPQWRLSFISFSRLFQKVVIMYRFQLLDSAYIKYRLISKHCSSLFFLPQSEGTAHETILHAWRKRHYNSRNLYTWATCSCSYCALRNFSGKIINIPFQFNGLVCAYSIYDFIVQLIPS